MAADSISMTPMLETAFFEDCQKRTEPHGFYGAMFQPCEFQFRQSIVEEARFDHDFIESCPEACLDINSNLVAHPIPMMSRSSSNNNNKTGLSQQEQWQILATEWQQSQWWPDQCVAVMPRCYNLQDGYIDDRIAQALQALLSSSDNDELLQQHLNEATHVRVDCTTDALQANRIIAALPSGKNAPFGSQAASNDPWMILWALTILVAWLWCCYSSARWWCCSSRRPSVVGGKRQYGHLDESDNGGDANDGFEIERTGLNMKMKNVI